MLMPHPFHALTSVHAGRPISRRAKSRDRRGSRGQGLAEFALVFPIFVLLVAAMVDFGMGLFSYMTVNNATRVGTRLAVTACTALVEGCEGAVAATIVNASNGLIASSKVDVRCFHVESDGSETEKTCAAGDGTGYAKRGDIVKVTVEGEYHMIWPLAFGNTVGLDAKAQLPLE